MIRTGFLQNIAQRYWLYLAFVLLGLAAGSGYALLQPPRYEARTTFVFKMGDVFKTGKSAMPALEVLTRTPNIRNSVVGIATSRQTAEAAFDETHVATDRVSIRANMIGNSTVLAITVQGSDPTATMQVAAAVGGRATAYVQEAFKVYELVQLDAPSATPVQSNRLLPILAGGLAGVVLGTGLAVFSRFLFRRTGSVQEP